MTQPSKDTIHVVCNIDEGYTKYCAVMLLSLFDNSREDHFHAHIVADHLSEKAQQSIRNVTDRFGHELSFYFDHRELVENCPKPENSHISAACYYRCFLDVILPDSVHKVLYLDCDVLVRDSVRELWDTNISGYALGAVEDMWADKDFYYERLGFEPRYSYFNSGMMLVNLDYWRQFGMTQKVFEYLKTFEKEYFYYDQDILNKLFYDKKLFLPFRWNAQDEYFRTKRTARKEVWAELDQCILNPAILHFTGSKKPWHFIHQHPYKPLYYYYLDQTEWKGERPRKTLYDYNKIITNKIPVLLGIKKRVFRKIPKRNINVASRF